MQEDQFTNRYEEGAREESPKKNQAYDKFDKFAPKLNTSEINNLQLMLANRGV